jgi:hypothetical protein
LLSEGSFAQFKQASLKAKGDLFCIVFGCSTPIVMRSYLDASIVPGEGFLQGVIQGEALQVVEDEELRVQDFKLY